MRQPSISIVIPSFNAEAWIESTLNSVIQSAQLSNLSSEVVVLDDGSTDESLRIIDGVSLHSSIPIRAVSQENQGRFMAVWNGVQEAEGSWLLILNSRQLLRKDFFQNLEQRFHEYPGVNSWCSHVETDPHAPLIGHFWTIPTAVFWGDYWRNLMPTDVTLENFDRVPKGTGGLVVRKEIFVEACLANWPSENMHYVSDDTKILRHISKSNPIRLDPELFSTYRPRTSVKAFLSHAFGRGTMFVDSYAGTSNLRNLILLVFDISPIISLIAGFVLYPYIGLTTIYAVFGVFFSAVIIFCVLGIRNHSSIHSAVSFLVLSFPFSIFFWLGLVRGTIIHRSSFSLKAGKTA